MTPDEALQAAINNGSCPELPRAVFPLDYVNVFYIQGRGYFGFSPVGEELVGEFLEGLIERNVPLLSFCGNAHKAVKIKGAWYLYNLCGISKFGEKSQKSLDSILIDKVLVVDVDLNTPSTFYDNSWFKLEVERPKPAIFERTIYRDPAPKTTF